MTPRAPLASRPGRRRVPRAAATEGDDDDDADSDRSGAAPGRQGAPRGDRAAGGGVRPARADAVELAARQPASAVDAPSAPPRQKPHGAPRAAGTQPPADMRRAARAAEEGGRAQRG